METSRLTSQRIREYLREGKRFDERALDEFREISIETGISKNAEGSCRVKFGKTEVIVGVKMDVATPYPDSPNKGNLIVNAELLPLSSPRFETGPPKFPAIELGRVIDRVIRESKFIELEKLCIKEGEKVWSVFVDIYSINDDGNLLDAAALGAVIALKNARIPKWDEKEEKVSYGELTKKKLPVKKEIPLSITFYKIGEKFVVDPTKEEEDSADLRITLGSYKGSISSIQKGGEKSLSVNEFYALLDSYKEIWERLFKKIEKFLK